MYEHEIMNLNYEEYALSLPNMDLSKNIKQICYMKYLPTKELKVYKYAT